VSKVAERRNQPRSMDIDFDLRALARAIVYDRPVGLEFAFGWTRVPTLDAMLMMASYSRYNFGTTEREKEGLAGS
jgi:hypothetical protein